MMSDSWPRESHSSSKYAQNICVWCFHARGRMDGVRSVCGHCTQPAKYHACFVGLVWLKTTRVGKCDIFLQVSWMHLKSEKHSWQNDMNRTNTQEIIRHFLYLPLTYVRKLGGKLKDHHRRTKFIFNLWNENFNNLLWWCAENSIPQIKPIIL